MPESTEYEVKISRQAKKGAAKLPASDWDAVLGALEGLETNPYPAEAVQLTSLTGVKKKNINNLYKLTLKDIRVAYQVFEDESPKRVQVRLIGERENFYKKLSLVLS